MLGIGNWLWIDAGDGEGWWEQPQTVGCLDLASFAQIVAARPGQPRGVGMFQFAPDASTKAFEEAGGVLLSSEDARDGRPDGKGLDAIESMTGYRPNGDTWVDCLWDCMTAGADPANLDAVGILVPTVQRNLELWFANMLCRREAFDFATHPHAAKVKTLLRAQLNAVRDAALAGQMINAETKQVDLEYHLRIADAMCEKYAGRSETKKSELWIELKPSTWEADETPKKHATTITENFNTADSDTLGPTLTWSEVDGDWDIVSNKAEMVTNFGSTSRSARAESDLSSTDHYSQAVTSGSGTPGVAARFASAAETYYEARLNVRSSTVGTYVIQKVVTGTLTVLGTSSTESTTGTKTLKLVCNSDALECFVDTVSKVSLTDSSITTGTRCGIAGYDASGSANPIHDDFEASDLAAPAGHPAMRRLGLCRYSDFMRGQEGARVF